MPGPWERYKAATAPEAPVETGPWTRYQPDTVGGGRAEPAPRGVQVYTVPAGPPQASALDQAKEALTNPVGWTNLALGRRGAYDPMKSAVAGTPPAAIPGAIVPRLAKAATALAEGKTLAHAVGRVALSSGQGAVMSGADRKAGESPQDTVDRASFGAKLSGGIQLAAEAIPVIGKVAGAVARKAGAAISGVDESLIQNYAKRTEQVNKLIHESGGDVTTAADQVRTELSAGIQSAKSRLNAQITTAIEKAAPETTVTIQPIISALENAKARLNPNFKAGAISEIDDMLNAIWKESKDGSVSVSSLYQIKQFLNEGAKPAYNKGGQIFTRANEAARAAKEAAAEARAMMKPLAPEISAADAQLSRLHAIESRLNKNLLAPGKPDGALMAAGSGGNARNAATLRELERISGVPASQRAKDLATARVFANPSLVPTDSTGKAAARMLVAGGLGSAVAGPVGVGAAALASPAAVKFGVNAANIAGKNLAKLPNVGRAVRENPLAAQTVVQLGAGQIRRANAPDEPKQAPGSEPELNQPRLMERQPPLKGEALWASRGAEKLKLSSERTQALLATRDGKRLLIEASELKPGSPQMKRIIERLERMTTDGLSTRSAVPAEVHRNGRAPARGR